jgi:hypothetical protein
VKVVDSVVDGSIILVTKQLSTVGVVVVEELVESFEQLICTNAQLATNNIKTIFFIFYFFENKYVVF